MRQRSLRAAIRPVNRKVRVLFGLNTEAAIGVPPFCPGMATNGCCRCSPSRTSGSVQETRSAPERAHVCRCIAMRLILTPLKRGASLVPSPEARQGPCEEHANDALCRQAQGIRLRTSSHTQLCRFQVKRVQRMQGYSVVAVTLPQDRANDKLLAVAALSHRTPSCEVYEEAATGVVAPFPRPAVAGVLYTIREEYPP